MTHEIRNAGREAAAACRPSYSNPHVPFTPEHEAWFEGWVEGVELRERAEDNATR